MNRATCLLVLIVFLGCGKGSVEPRTEEARRIALDAESVWKEHLALRAHGNADTPHIQSVIGHVAVSSDDGHSWRNAQVGEELKAGWILRTEKNGVVNLDFVVTGLALWVTENSRLKLVRMDVENTGLEKVGDTMIDLEAGRIDKNARKVPAATSLFVRTPAGVVTDPGWISISANGVIR